MQIIKLNQHVTLFNSGQNKQKIKKNGTFHTKSYKFFKTPNAVIKQH